MESEQTVCTADTDPYLRIIHLRSSGATSKEARDALGLSPYMYNKMAKKAVLLLKRHTGLRGEALNAILAPRRPGTPPKHGFYPRYSGPAVSIARAQQLDMFHELVEAVAREQICWNEHGLYDVSRWLAGWRPADHWASEAFVASANMVDWDLKLHIWPNGLRLDHMVGAIDTIDLVVHPRECAEDVLCAVLPSDVADPESGAVFHEGCRVAFPLAPTEADRWQTLLKSNPRKSKRLPLKLVHVAGDRPSVSFTLM